MPPYLFLHITKLLEAAGSGREPLLDALVLPMDEAGIDSPSVSLDAGFFFFAIAARRKIERSQGERALSCFHFIVACIPHSANCG